MSKTNLHEGHRERMRIRFSRNGFENYRPHEVLEQVLFLVIPRANTNETAHLLVNRFGSLSGVLNASVNELMEVHGIGRKAAEFIASLKPNFASFLENFYRKQGVFGVNELALVADLTLFGCRGKFLAAVFNEEEQFTGLKFADAVYCSDGTADAVGTAKRLAETAGAGVCVIVTGDADFPDEISAETIIRIMSDMGCSVRQFLYTEAGALYSLI